MKKLIILICLSIILSCKTYIDEGNRKDLVTNHYAFSLNTSDKKFNTVESLPRIPSKSDKTINYRQNFKINIPKKIVNWEVNENEFLFEYPNGQIILIDSGYKNDKLQGISKKWELSDASDNILEKYLWDYCTKNKHQSDVIVKYNRITKVYTNKQSYILLFNIKKENFDVYFDLMKSFKAKE